MKAPSAAEREQGVACVTADDFRWEKAHIKAVSLLGAVIGSLLWLADEALYYTTDSVNGRQVLVGINRQGREFRRITLPDGFAGGLVLGP